MAVNYDDPAYANGLSLPPFAITTATVKQLRPSLKPRSKKLTSDKFTKLIDLYKENRCLWDVTLVQTTKDEKRRALKAISEALGVSVSEVAVKWQNLRTTFGRHLKKITVSNRSDSGMDDVYVPRWQYFKRMEFLTECVRGRTYKSSRPYPSIIISDVFPLKDEKETDALNIETNESLTMECMTPESSISIDDMLSISPSTSERVTPQFQEVDTNVPVPKRVKADESLARGSNLLDLAVSRLEASASCQPLSMSRHFGEWVGSYMEQLPENRRIEAMREINEVLFRASKA